MISFFFVFIELIAELDRIPIIIVPAAPTSKITLHNIKHYLEDSEYVTLRSMSVAQILTIYFYADGLILLSYEKRVCGSRNRSQWSVRRTARQ